MDLKTALDILLEEAFEQGYTDQQIDEYAQDAVEEFGRPGQTVSWSPAFGGSFVING